MWRWIKWIMEDEWIEKALELRRQGYSYREIAKKLGCSKSLVASKLSPYEDPRARTKQAVELADQVEKLNKMVNEMNQRINELKSRLSEVKTLEELSKSNAELRKEIQLLAQKVGEHEANIAEITALLKGLMEVVTGG
jgi:predicted transcriptional regulator